MAFITRLNNGLVTNYPAVPPGKGPVSPMTASTSSARCRAYMSCLPGTSQVAGGTKYICHGIQVAMDIHWIGGRHLVLTDACKLAATSLSLLIPMKAQKSAAMYHMSQEKFHDKSKSHNVSHDVLGLIS